MKKKKHWSEQNKSLFETSPEVGAKVCLGCLDEQRLTERKATVGLTKLPHSFVHDVCRFKEPGKIRFEPGEEAFLAQQKRLDKEVPF